jgi:DNA-binding NarL/FixJ family response regulator
MSGLALAQARVVSSRWNRGLAPLTSATAKDFATQRERDGLAMISQGCANKRIAWTLEISPETVRSHIERISSKARGLHAHRGGLASRMPWVGDARTRRWRTARGRTHE